MQKELIRPCIGYIEDRLGKPLDNNALAESSGDMKNLCIKDVDTYDSIAQALNIKKLLRTQNIHYHINISSDKSCNDSWTIILSNHMCAEFEQKYGKKYDMSKPHIENPQI